MHVIAVKTIRQFADQYADVRKQLIAWLMVAEQAEWASITDVRIIFPKTNAVKVSSGKDVHVFNIKGNHYRLIVAIHFNRGKVYILRLFTHAEYSKDAWKGQL